MPFRISSLFNFRLRGEGAKMRWRKSGVQGRANIKWVEIEVSEKSRETEFEKDKVIKKVKTLFHNHITAKWVSGFSTL